MYALAKQLYREKNTFWEVVSRNGVAEIITERMTFERSGDITTCSALLNEKTSNVLPEYCCVENPVTDISKEEVLRILIVLRQIRSVDLRVYAVI